MAAILPPSMPGSIAGSAGPGLAAGLCLGFIRHLKPVAQAGGNFCPFIFFIFFISSP
jgi:hypothetical protein